MKRKRQEGTIRTRMLARLIRTLLQDEEFATVADLTDAVKFRCARLHVPWSNDDLAAALAMVGSNRPLVQPPEGRDWKQRAANDSSEEG